MAERCATRDVFKAFFHSAPKPRLVVKVPLDKINHYCFDRPIEAGSLGVQNRGLGVGQFHGDVRVMHTSPS